MKRKKLSNKTKGKIIIISTISLIIALVAGVIFSHYVSIMYGGWDNYIEGNRKQFSIFVMLAEHGGLLTVFGPIIVIGGFVLLVIFVNQILPMLCFFISKPLAYLSIWFTCLRKKYSFRLHRVPLASLGGVSEKSDIEIQTKNKTLHIHFIDIPFPFLRIFLLVNDREYRMHNSDPGHLRGFGGFISPNNREMNPKKYTIYSIPEFPKSETECHYLVISPSYANAFFIGDRVMQSVIGECTSGNVTVCKLKVLKRRLKNELYNPLN